MTTVINLRGSFQTMSLSTVTTDCHYDDTTLQLIAAEATKVWQGFTKGEKSLVRFGMFPAGKMEELEGKFPDVQSGDRGRLCACALMDCAKADGGMRA